MSLVRHKYIPTTKLKCLETSTTLYRFTQRDCSSTKSHGSNSTALVKIICKISIPKVSFSTLHPETSMMIHAGAIPLYIYYKWLKESECGTGSGRLRSFSTGITGTPRIPVILDPNISPSSRSLSASINVFSASALKQDSAVFTGSSRRGGKKLPWKPSSGKCFLLGC